MMHSIIVKKAAFAGLGIVLFFSLAGCGSNKGCNNVPFGATGVK